MSSPPVVPAPRRPLAAATWLALALLVPTARALPAAAIWQVDAAAPCPGAGSPAAPFCTIQAALDAAGPGDTILVAPGTYAERLDFLGKDLALLSLSGPDGTIVDAGGSGSVVTFAHGEGAGARLSGFTLRNGGGTDLGSGFEPVQGGGILCLGASPVVEGNVIEHCAADAGGGIAILGGAPLVQDNVVRDNLATLGAGLHVAAGSSALITGNAIRGNGSFSTSIGGGIHVDEASPLIEGNLVEDNTSSSVAGIHADADAPVVVRGNLIRDNHTDEDEGGGLSTGPATVVEDNEIRDNLAQGQGGGIVCRGGTFRRNLVAGNSCSEGGGIAILGGSPSFDGDVFEANTGDLGAAISAKQSPALPPIDLRRVTVRGNLGGAAVAVLSGQAVFEDVLVAGNVEGLQLNNPSTSIVVRRSTFADNTYSAIVTWDGAQADLSNCIVWGNSLAFGLELAPETGSIDAKGCLVRLGYPGEGNFDADPLYVDAPGGDWSLLDGSPAIDAGDPADLACGFDLSGRPRRLDGDLDGSNRVDLGALEFGQVTLAAESPQPAVLEVGLAGTPGLAAWLVVGTQPAAVCVEKWGTLAVDLGAPHQALPWIPAPSSVEARVPAGASGLPVVLQALARLPDAPWGNFSNPLVLPLP